MLLRSLEAYKAEVNYLNRFNFMLQLIISKDKSFIFCKRVVFLSFARKKCFFHKNKQIKQTYKMLIIKDLFFLKEEINRFFCKFFLGKK